MFKSLMIRGLSTFLFLIDESTDRELEWMMYLFKLFVKTMLSASSIAQVLAVNMEASFGRQFLNVLFLNTASDPILLLSLEPSV